MNQHSTWIKYQKQAMKKPIPQDIVNAAIKVENCTSEVWDAEDLGLVATNDCIEWHNHLRDYLKEQKQAGIILYDLPKKKAEAVADKILKKMIRYL